jgi:hypothetical protein
MTQQIFEDLVGTPPPSTVDIKRIVERERRAQRTRWVSVLAGVAIVAVTASATFLLQPEPSKVDIAEKPSAAVTPTLALEGRAAVEARVNAAWMAATARELPGAKWSTTDDHTLRPAAPALKKIEGAYYTHGDITFNGHSGRFSFSAAELHVRAKILECQQQKIPACIVQRPQPECLPPVECSSIPGPNGTTFYLERSVGTVAGSVAPLVVLTATIVNDADGRAAVFSIANQKVWDVTPNMSTELALTFAELLAVLHEPGLLP